VAAILTLGFYHAWLLDVVGAQRVRADKLLGSAADTLPAQHPVAQIAKSLLQATSYEVNVSQIMTMSYFTGQIISHCSCAVMHFALTLLAENLNQVFNLEESLKEMGVKRG